MTSKWSIPICCIGSEVFLNASAGITFCSVSSLRIQYMVTTQGINM